MEEKLHAFLTSALPCWKKWAPRPPLYLRHPLDRDEWTPQQVWMLRMLLSGIRNSKGAAFESRPGRWIRHLMLFLCPPTVLEHFIYHTPTVSLQILIRLPLDATQRNTTASSNNNSHTSTSKHNHYITQATLAPDVTDKTYNFFLLTPITVQSTQKRVIQGGSNMTGTNWLVYTQIVPVTFEPPCTLYECDKKAYTIKDMERNIPVLSIHKKQLTEVGTLNYAQSTAKTGQ
jgi:hypothetical protein